MTHPSSATTTIAILGTEALVEDILARLLEREGYTTRHLLDPYFKGPMDDLLDGVDILLLAPGLDAEAREGFLKAMSTNPKTAAMPALTFSSALKLALLDELSASAPWSGLFEELVGQIGTALARAAASVEALVAEGRGAETTPVAPQADAL